MSYGRTDGSYNGIGLYDGTASWQPSVDTFYLDNASVREFYGERVERIRLHRVEMKEKRKFDPKRFRK